jgi:hypothetical protein
MAHKYQIRNSSQDAYAYIQENKIYSGRQIAKLFIDELYLNTGVIIK